MGAIFILAVFVFPIIAILIGVWLVVSAFSRPKRRTPIDPPIAQAQLVDDGKSRIKTPGTGRRHPVDAAVRIVIGTALSAGGIAFLKAVADFGNESHSKGRLLRLRGKAALPEVAVGGGWHDDARPNVDGLDAAAREALAKAWLVSARMEHASIAAFAQLSMHLAALGGPSQLVERTHIAALEEIRHSRRCYALARAFGGEAFTAGPIAELASSDASQAIDPIRLAIGTLVDGCVAEGVAADVTLIGSQRALDPVVRDTLAMIAREEATHAELAWSVLAWCLSIGGDAVADAVAARVARLDDELAPRTPEVVGIPADRLGDHGIVDQETIGAVAMRRIATVRTRTLHLLDAKARAA